MVVKLVFIVLLKKLSYFLPLQFLFISLAVTLTRIHTQSFWNQTLEQLSKITRSKIPRLQEIAKVSLFFHEFSPLESPSIQALDPEPLPYFSPFFGRKSFRAELFSKFSVERERMRGRRRGRKGKTTNRSRMKEERTCCLVTSIHQRSRTTLLAPSSSYKKIFESLSSIFKALLFSFPNLWAILYRRLILTESEWRSWVRLFTLPNREESRLSLSPHHGDKDK